MTVTEGLQADGWEDMLLPARPVGDPYLSADGAIGLGRAEAE